jgi:uncharacterized membrane protein
LQFLKKYVAPYFELVVWVAALLILAAINPASETHYSLCVFKWAGFSFCPGCGLGHSISWLFHGDIEQSFHAHPLGIFAVAVLLYRIFFLLKININQLTTSKQ